MRGRLFVMSLSEESDEEEEEELNRRKRARRWSGERWLIVVTLEEETRGKGRGLVNVSHGVTAMLSRCG
jgi:hypothetical protein